MAVPKYAKLPGIDVNSPDVFETSDLPEAEQSMITQQTVDCDRFDGVEMMTIDAQSAYLAFKDKRVTAQVDFSDTVAKCRPSGYFSDCVESELPPNSKQETVLQKYCRLQSEIQELEEEVSEMKSVVNDQCKEKISSINLGQQLHCLKHQLSNLHIENVLSTDTSVDLSDPQDLLRQRLLQQLESFSSKASPGMEKLSYPGTPKPDQVADSLTYQLYCRPQQAHITRNAKVAKLEERLERLENVIGQNKEKMSLLTAGVENKSLLGAVAMLNSKLSLMDPAILDVVEPRLQGIMHKLTQITDKQSINNEAEKQSKVSELFELMKKWEAVGETLPHVVDRMMSLKELHQQALQFSQALTYLDSAQQEVKVNFESHSDMLKQFGNRVICEMKPAKEMLEMELIICNSYALLPHSPVKLQTVFKDNMDAIMANVASIDKRINQLKN